LQSSKTLGTGGPTLAFAPSHPYLAGMNATSVPAAPSSLLRQPALFIPHGGGPCFFMDAPPGDPHAWDAMAAYLRGIAASLPERPRAILVISAHWETERPTVMAAERPPMLFDYYGFPEHTYRLRYPAPGSPALAARVRELLAGAGIESDADVQRGFDHGVFVPFLLMFPDADIPIVQLSLRADLNPSAHLAIGRALAPLRDEGVLIVGSGMSYHNLRRFWSTDAEDVEAAHAFDAWLASSIETADGATRDAHLADWANAPGARAAHPRSEHLLPLMVAAGAADGDRGRRTYGDRVFGKAVSGFRFG
jgi:aromatic ring-opening dioxygenase catalytic subunit (LigB family)